MVEQNTNLIDKSKFPRNLDSGIYNSVYDLLNVPACTNSFGSILCKVVCVFKEMLSARRIRFGLIPDTSSWTSNSTLHYIYASVELKQKFLNSYITTTHFVMSFVYNFLLGLLFLIIHFKIVKFYKKELFFIYIHYFLLIHHFIH